MGVTNEQLLFAIKTMSDHMGRLIEAIEKDSQRRSMFGAGTGGISNTVNIDNDNVEIKLDTLIDSNQDIDDNTVNQDTKFDEIKVKQDAQQVTLQNIDDNTIAAGGQTAAESLIDGTTSVASSLISGASTVIGSMTIAGASVLIFGATSIASIVNSLLTNSDLIESDLDEIRQITVDQKGHWHYAANWKQPAVLGAARFDFEFNEEFRLNTIWMARIAGAGTPTLKLRFRDKEESNDWEQFETDAAGVVHVHHYPDLDRLFPKQFILRVDLGNLTLNDEWLVGITGRYTGTTLPTITQWGTPVTETIFRNHIHL